MNNHSLKMLSLLAGLAALGSLTVQAQDKATLDLLVRKNVITQDEANSIAKTSGEPAIVAGPKDSNVKSLKIEGMIQTQYEALSTKDESGAAGVHQPPGNNEFMLRRVYFGAVADLGNGWGGEILTDLAAVGQTPVASNLTTASNSGASQNLFEKVVITKKFDDLDGMATVGYRKVDFTQEEITSSSQLKAPERSVVSRYFDENYGTPTSRRLGFADRHTGIFWNGTVAALNNDLYYSAAFTNGIQNADLQFANPGGGAEFAGWAALGYKEWKSDDALKFDFGINFGATDDQNSVSNIAPAVGVVNANEGNSMWGYNPYVKVNYAGFELSAEFLQVSVDNGRGPAPSGATAGAAATAASHDSTATPYGWTITPSYKINDQWEIATRYAYLNTNGRGTNISDVVRDGPNTITGGSEYDDVSQFYLGVNYYIIGTSVKISVGGELDEFGHRQAALGGNFNGGRAEVEGLRAQLQLTF
jgi:hypothetical protein